MSLTCYDDTGSWRGQRQEGLSPQSLWRTFFLRTVFSADFYRTFFSRNLVFTRLVFARFFFFLFLSISHCAGIYYTTHSYNNKNNKHVIFSKNYSLCSKQGKLFWTFEKKAPTMKKKSQRRCTDHAHFEHCQWGNILHP
jgi:hypothetical protein